ncbi:MAG: aminopeptidase [Alteromonadaceae bacterium]|nr:MAG: aminopeptidase [Alteromonadaceae bacterium]
MIFKSTIKLSLLIVIINSLSACSTISYYSQAIKGQIQLLLARESIDKLITAEDTSPELRERLILIQAVRAYAQQDLHLPVGKAYASYADLERPYAVWNIYAAPPLSLQAYTWCYPVVGCLAYRGYFNQQDAEKHAEQLKQQSLEVRVGGVRAYSTLGFFNDPVLNTFIDTTEPYLVELLIHEITHRLLYIKGDTKFNESFATAVAQIATQRWYQQQDQAEKYAQYQAEETNDRLLRNLLLEHRNQLEKIYSDDTRSEPEKIDAKKQQIAQMHEQYFTAKAAYGWRDGLDNWILSVNNASLATMANYNGFVPAFKQIFEQQGQDFPGFYQAVTRLSELKKVERHAALEKLMSADVTPES